MCRDQRVPAAGDDRREDRQSNQMILGARAPLSQNAAFSRL
jgi:hypothetical protein